MGNSPGRDPSEVTLHGVPGAPRAQVSRAGPAFPGIHFPLSSRSLPGSCFPGPFPSRCRAQPRVASLGGRGGGDHPLCPVHSSSSGAAPITGWMRGRVPGEVTECLPHVQHAGPPPTRGGRTPWAVRASPCPQREKKGWGLVWSGLRRGGGPSQGDGEARVWSVSVRWATFDHGTHGGRGPEGPAGVPLVCHSWLISKGSYLW